MTKEVVSMFPCSGRHRRVLPVVLCLFALPSVAGWSIDDDRSNSFKHGLYEIREEARRFVFQENARHGTHWEAIEPNAKVFVPLCKTPLKTGWATGSPRPGVSVACARSVDGSYRAWNVTVPVRNGPAGSAHWPCSRARPQDLSAQEPGSPG